MKYLKLLLVIVLSCVLVLPFAVYADDETTTEETTSEETTSSEDDQKVNVYLFRGEGCPHCQEFEEWIESDDVKNNYGQYFNLVDYEVWYDEDNADLMEKVADARGEDVSGVPYIIVGNKTWNGFDESYEEEILSEIKSQYDTEVSDRYDIMTMINSSNKSKKSNSSSSTDVVAVILIILVVGAIVFGIVQARKKTN